MIEVVFPAQKISFEAQRERKAGPGQTLTALGSYWKGRKPLILVRAIVLGSLLPQTDDAEKDLEIFEKLMAFDDEGLARRALIQNALKPKDIAARIELDNPWTYFKAKIRNAGLSGGDIRNWQFPLDADAKGISLTWRRDITDEEKLALYRKALVTFHELRGQGRPSANAPKRSIRIGSMSRCGLRSTATTRIWVSRHGRTRNCRAARSVALWAPPSCGRYVLWGRVDPLRGCASWL